MNEHENHPKDEVQDPAEQYKTENRVEVTEEELVTHEPEDDDPQSLAGDEVKEEDNA